MSQQSSSQSRQPAGWSVLVKEALELGVLALASWATQSAQAGQIARDDVARVDHAPQAGEPDPRMHAVVIERPVSPEEFASDASEDAAFYRAHDAAGEMTIAFYSDGRLHMTAGERRFAGMLQNDHAHVLLVGTQDWSEVYVRTTPGGVVQLELRGGPDDGRVLTCEPAERSEASRAV